MENLGVIDLFDVYKNKKVLITGHTGFKGSWLTLWLLKLGAKVTGYALNPKTAKDNFVLCDLKNKIKDYREDIRDYKKLYEVFEEEEPEIIFHLAAQPLVLDSYENPLYTIETNTQGTANILEAFRHSNKAKILIIITTDKVYENFEWEWGYRESDQLGGSDPYSASKAASEILISSYQRSFFNEGKKKVVSVRAGNVIGGGDWSENRLIPDCIRALENNEKIIIRNPNSTRPWQHVLEPLGGYLLLGQKLLEESISETGAWNFGPFFSNIITVEELVSEIIDCYGNGEYEIRSNKNAPKESNFLSLDISKASRKLKWKPVLNLEETIKFTIDWYKLYSSSNVFEYSYKQICNYQNKMVNHYAKR